MASGTASIAPMTRGPRSCVTPAKRLGAPRYEVAVELEKAAIAGPRRALS